MTKSNRKLYPREESSWRNMISRCYNPKATGYRWYGGRGIKVCEAWKTFENFYNDMGPRPEATSIDRIDSNGDYEPGNCKWSTYKEQGVNKRGIHAIDFLGQVKSIEDWGQFLGIKPNTIVYRLKRGWSIERALTTNKEKAIAKERRAEGDIDDEL